MSSELIIPTMRAIILLATVLMLTTKMVKALPGPCSAFTNCIACTEGGSGYCLVCGGDLFVSSGKLTCVTACSSGETLLPGSKICAPTPPAEDDVPSDALYKYGAWMFQVAADFKSSSSVKIDVGNFVPTRKPACRCRSSQSDGVDGAIDTLDNRRMLDSSNIGKELAHASKLDTSHLKQQAEQYSVPEITLVQVDAIYKKFDTDSNDLTFAELIAGLSMYAPVERTPVNEASYYFFKEFVTDSWASSINDEEFGTTVWNTCFGNASNEASNLSQAREMLAKYEAEQAETKRL